MLQQTQVATVIPYFERFMLRFPDINTLAQASLDEVLKHWAGLGYYARGRNLHRAAIAMQLEHAGKMPDDFDALIALPGIGRSTAGAILAQAFNQRYPIMDGNVRRVLARRGDIHGWPGRPEIQAKLWQLAESLLPEQSMANYTQALMDLGSLVCTNRNPDCDICPVSADCAARLQNTIAQLPTPKPRKVRPMRHCQALIIQDSAGRVLLVKRPPAGIWGGLWSLPIRSTDNSSEPLSDRDAGSSEAIAYLPSFKHAFTHFELMIEPRLGTPSTHASLIQEQAERRWVNLDDPGAWPGMPAPLRKLLEQAQQHLCAPITA